MGNYYPEDVSLESIAIAILTKMGDGDDECYEKWYNIARDEYGLGKGAAGDVAHMVEINKE